MGFFDLMAGRGSRNQYDHNQVKAARQRKRAAKKARAAKKRAYKKRGK